MTYYQIADGRIVGQFAQLQDGVDLLPATHPDAVAALAMRDQETATRQAQETAYGYAVARGRDYTQQFSKAPHPNSTDAIGHVLDALLEWADQHEVTPALQEILDKRAEIKARHPKP